MEEIPANIQDVLDLIEWANGPVTSKGVAKRATAGHPEPFNLEYLGVGPVFECEMPPHSLAVIRVKSQTAGDPK